jgi:hypothetical protein
LKRIESPASLVNLRLTGPVMTTVLAALLAALTGLTALELESTGVENDVLFFPESLSTLR